MFQQSARDASRLDAPGPSGMVLALATAAAAVAVVALVAGISQASDGDSAGSETCGDRVASWAADMAPQTNGFNNEDIARRTADVQRAAAEALQRC